MDTIFKISNHEIVIENWLEVFNSIYRYFHETSYERIEDFMDGISEMTDLDTIMENLEERTMKIIYPFVDKSIEILTKFGVWNVSRENFIKEFYDDYFPFITLYNEYASVYDEILENAEQQKRYRDYQRSSRSKWTGGGFGLSGAIHGAINAGILNAVTGTFRFIGDSVVNVMDSYSVNVDKQRLHDSDFFENYAMDLRQMCDHVGVALYVKLQHLGIVKRVHFSLSEVKAIVSNLEKHNAPREKKIEMLIQCIKKYPYNFEIYKHLFSILGMNNIEVAKLANYFGLKYELQAHFIDVIYEPLQDVIDLPETTPIQCDQKCNKMQAILDKYFIYNKEFLDAFNVEELYYEITNQICKLREKAISVGEQSFKNVESAQKYYEQKEREAKAAEAHRIAYNRRQENISTAIKVVITIVVIGVVIFFAIRWIPKIYNLALDVIAPETSIDRIEALNEDESKYFENSSVLNYHRWFGGDLVLDDTGTTDSGIPYKRYIYSYDNDKYPKQYMDMLVKDGFSLITSDDSDEEEKLKKTVYRKVNSEDKNKTLTVQVSIYYDRNTVSIMFNTN